MSTGISYGCGGGDICDAVDFLKTSGYHFVAEGAYLPYTGEKRECREQVRDQERASNTHGQVWNSPRMELSLVCRSYGRRK